MNAAPDPDTQLFLQVQQGDRAAFDELMRRFEGKVLGLVHRYVGPRGDAEDVAQEVFLKVYRARKSFEPRARFSTWLYRITVNLCLNDIRGRGAAKRALGSVSHSAPAGRDGEGSLAPTIRDERLDAPSDAAARGEEGCEVRRAIAALPEAQRIALVLNRYEEMSYDDLASVLGLTVPAVKSLLFRARENVKKTLAPLSATASPERERVREASP